MGSGTTAEREDPRDDVERAGWGRTSSAPAPVLPLPMAPTTGPPLPMPPRFPLSGEEGERSPSAPKLELGLRPEGLRPTEVRPRPAEGVGEAGAPPEDDPGWPRVAKAEARVNMPPAPAAPGPAPPALAPRGPPAVLCAPPAAPCVGGAKPLGMGSGEANGSCGSAVEPHAEAMKAPGCGEEE